MRNPAFWRFFAFLLAAALLVAIAIFVSPLVGILGLLAATALATSASDDRSMLTPRGRALLAVSAMLAVTGVSLQSAATVALLGLTLLLWIGFEWIRFALRARLALPQIRVERSVTQGGRTVRAGWAGLSFLVRYRVCNDSRWHCPLVDVQDVHSNSQNTQDTVALIAKSERAGEYTIEMLQPGVLQFAGFHLTLCDFSGFFRAEAFVPLPSTITVMSPLTDAEGRQRTDKRFNALPPPGLHRLRMPGSGSELLDLRDYRPGDPPKMIAWKPSARRDRLITKEFESEVPVRCTLLLDCSNSVRVDDGHEIPLAKLATAAAGILLAANANRDLVGAAFFDAKQSRIISPARTSSHAMRLLDEFARAAALVPDVPDTNPHVLAERVEPLLMLRTPALFDRFANSRPWSFHWRPLLDTRWGWLIFLPLALTPILITQMAWLDFAARAGRRFNPGTGKFGIDFTLFLFGFLIVLMLPSALAMLFWLGFGLRGYLPGARKSATRRKRMAAVFAAQDDDTAAAIERYCLDDDAFANRTGRFLSKARLRIPVRRFSAEGHDRFRDVEKIAIASRVIVRATSRARDNELYVLLADLLDCADDLEPLIRAIKLARSRHHHVLVIITWPGDVPLKRKPRRPFERDDLEHSVRHVMIEGCHRRYEKLRREMTRAGAAVLRLTDRDTVRTVLNYLDRLRGARSHR